MAWDATTVTPPNPTPPTNMSCLGTTPPTAPNETTIDDGAAGVLTLFAANRPSADGANFPSYAHEGAGTEDVETSTSPNPSPYGQTQAVSCLGDYTATPNASHPSNPNYVAPAPP